jgi:rhodanese-related sulfurtransferase
MRADQMALLGHWIRGPLFAAAVIICIGAPGITAAQNPALTQELESYFEFVDYGGGVLFSEQIPRDMWQQLLIIDTRDAAQYAKGHIPGAINIEWRQLVAKRNTISKVKQVLVYCNTGSLSAQAGLAMRLAGWDNVRILQGGFEEWRAKGGFDAYKKSSGSDK